MLSSNQIAGFFDHKYLWKEYNGIFSSEPRVYFDNSRSLEKALSGKELHRKLLLLAKKY